MKRIFTKVQVSFLAVGLLCLAAPLARTVAQEKAAIPAGGTVNVVVTAGAPPPPPVSITLNERHAHVTPCQGKCAHAGGGVIDVALPAPDTLVVTMTGAVVASAKQNFELDQGFEVSFDDPKVKRAKVTVEARVIGVLRGEPKGCAEYSDACAYVNADAANLVGVCVPPHSVCGKCENLGVNDHDGPHTSPIAPGKYMLRETFAIAARSDSYLHKRPSAEFAPDPALDPLWISYWDPFHGAIKRDFGFQVVVHVVADSGPEPVPAPDKVRQGN
jgi:hypothetical protein